MANVVALQSGIIRLKKDELGDAPKDKQGNPIGPRPVRKQGESFPIVKGQMFSDNHPAVKAAPALFGLPDALQAPSPAQVEQATAAPGEQRGRR